MKIKIFAFAALLFASMGLQAQIDRSKMPEPGPAPKVNIEDPETFSLDNGLQVMVVENHKLPRVAISLSIDNPPRFDGDKVGVSSLAGELFGTGTQTMSKEDFNERVDFLGARMFFGSSGANASTLSKYFPEIISLMADATLNPKFTEEEFSTVKDRTLQSMKANEKDVSYNANRVRQALAYGKDHPFGEFTTEESVENLQVSDVQNYYDTYYSPENAYLVIVGDVDEDEVKDLVKKNFSSWKNKAIPQSEMPEVTNVDQTQINFVDMPNAVQSEIALINTLELSKKDSDYFPAIVANKILGGTGGQGRLFQNLREDKGYTYGAYSRLGDNKYVSSFYAFASVRNEVTDSAVVQFLDELYKMRKEKVTPKELADAKAKLTGDFVLSLEQPTTIARFALERETEDLDDDFYEDYLENIDNVSLEDVQRVANKYFMADNTRIVIAGKGSDVLESLENFTYNGKQVPIKYYDRFAEETEKPEEKTVDASVTVDKVFSDYIKAIGGKEAVESVESLVMQASTTMQGMKLDMSMKTTKDGKMLQEVSMNGNVMQKQVFDGSTGYAMAQGQKIPYTEEQIEAAKGDANPFPELSVGEASLEGIEQVEGQDAYKVKMNDKKTNFYAVDGGLKIKSVQTVSQMGQTMTIPTIYSDYQEVKGVKFPFTISQSLGPQNIDFSVSEYKINEGVTADEFNVE